MSIFIAWLSVITLERNVFQDSIQQLLKKEKKFSKGRQEGIHVYSDYLCSAVLCYKTEHSGKPFSGPQLLSHTHEVQVTQTCVQIQTVQRTSEQSLGGRGFIKLIRISSISVDPLAKESVTCQTLALACIAHT